MVDPPLDPPAPYPPELAALTATAPDAYRTVHYGPDANQFGELWPATGDRAGSRTGGRAASGTGGHAASGTGGHAASGTGGRAGERSLAPVVVLVHGGYWRDRYRLDLMHAMAADLAGRGFAVWNVEYRRVGSPGGGWPGTFLDVAAAFDALADLAAQHRLDLTRIAAVGHSAGGHLALWACGRGRPDRERPIAATGARDADGRSGAEAAQPFPSGLSAPPRVAPALAVSLAGVTDLRRADELGLSDNAVRGLLGGGPEEIPAVYDLACPAGLLPLGVPQVVLHGTADTDVPLELATRYARRAGAECDLVVLPDADHIALIDPDSAAWPSVLGALDRV